MIVEGTATGGSDLPAHVADTEANEIALLSRAEGVPGATFEECHKNLLLMSIGARTEKPLWHAFASPSVSYSEHQWEAFWAEYEGIFGLTGQPFYEAHHLKIGASRVAAHRHRVYLRVLPNRKLITTSHSYLKNERIARWAEYTNGERLVKGRHNRAVAAALEAGGRSDISDSMKRRGLLDGDVPSATRPHERRMTERAGDISHDEVCRRVWAAWRRTGDAEAFVRGLAADGLYLAQGDKVPVVVTGRGVVHPLLRAINIGAKQMREKATRKTDLERRLAGLTLANVDTVKATAPEKKVLPLHQIIGLDRTVPRRTPRLSTSEQSAAPRQKSRPEKKGPPSPRPRSGKMGPASMPIVKSRTPDQIAKSRAFLDVLEKGAATQADQLVREAEQRADQRQAAQELAERLAAAKAAARELHADLLRPTAGLPGWRNAYKARLAGLPPDIGVRIRWVERECAGERTITLHTGERIRLLPDRATGSEPSSAVANLMIEHALARGWSAIEFSGGTPAWRVAAARLAVRRGLPVANLDLAHVAAAEQAAMPIEALVANWRRARQAVSDEPESTAFRQRFVATMRALRKKPGYRSTLQPQDLALLHLDLILLAAREAGLEGWGINPTEFEAYSRTMESEDELPCPSGEMAEMEGTTSPPSPRR